MMMINVKTAQRKLTAEKYDEEWDFALSVPLCPGLPGAIVMSNPRPSLARRGEQDSRSVGLTRQFEQMAFVLAAEMLFFRCR